ncbi:MAG: hypothetical protein JJE55_13095 [Flavobacteriaceae bacterium]|nr:hypothetical protein [Flavobacteriaceae bacterium]
MARITENIFPYLGVEENIPLEIIKNKLKDTTFSNMVALLANVYMSDEHLRPQYMKARLSIRIFKITIRVPIRIRKVYKLESLEDLSILKEIFGIDTEIKVNATLKTLEKLTWTQQDLQIINKLYKRDFERFKYDIRN